MTEQFQAEQRVLYGDTDSMGVAYYANYLKWFEIGRTELFRRVGSSYHSVEVGLFLACLRSLLPLSQPGALR